MQVGRLYIHLLADYHCYIIFLIKVFIVLILITLPTEGNWGMGAIQELIQHVFNIASRPNLPRKPLRKFWSEPYQTQYNQYFKSLQFNNIDTAPVHDLDRAMVALHDDVSPTIDSMCREWQGIKVWPVLFVRYESANPLDKPFKIFDAQLPATHSIFLHYQPELYANRPNPHYPAIQRLAQRRLEANTKFIRGKSGLVLAEIYSLNLNVVRFAPFSGSAWSPLPKFLQNKKEIVNV